MSVPKSNANTVNINITSDVKEELKKSAAIIHSQARALDTHLRPALEGVRAMRGGQLVAN